MADVFVINIEDNISKEMYHGLFSAVSKKRAEKIRKYRFEIDAKRCLFASVLVRYITCCKMNLKNENICFSNNQYGKPYLYGLKNQYFNVSHSGKWVVCGWSTHEIGIDIEVVTDIDLGIARKYFCEAEYLSILNTNVDEQKKLFFDFWTLKESYIKYKGYGLLIPLNSFQFNLKLGKINLISGDKKKPLFYRAEIDEIYKLAVCTEDSEIVGVIHVSPRTIWNKLCK
ncbi:4'-phosphopantetheinyl transferase superfamily protein [Clostridium tagluense]|uniref:4'-phosphopantetheinyl transferase family protein n=1 Tax=Clostridium tagluense TaxID=360422 RepID=UPI001CF45620|nr:4'-phosphopantetheinyl transferase superfamily protein [Clostridium tagluense]MCB2312716.1 4'-phosphopantetheinyl transferase superfamily protein [Clostridium tagluense]MCB2317483.1 4'-phosphopantetheinyl transferase superfamily protein [Clostridium tagluense]MCB2322286.1 4'-phosphopantetheinyl transferase superfamily protein [Clostridium tagluense]MCB2327290.1 4'-phosphopantetheinyl transferase superfamily protein [Clostridium tagluense]MCB2331984.1 4'-phosphopantetheinyl transferase super